jgi:hypothetical protein
VSAQVAADLRAAADVLERMGWTRDAYVNPDGRCCAVGALAKALEPDFGPRADIEDLAADQYHRAKAAAQALLPLVDPRRREPAIFWEAPITAWNDRDERTADEVIAALRAAADRAEAAS